MVDHPPAAPPAPPPVAPGAWPPLAPVITPPPGRLGRLAVVLAGLSLLAYLVAAVVSLIPVQTPGVQDCGAPAAYLLGGRLDRIPDEEGRVVDADGRIVTLDDDTAATARATPCRERVADRAVPAAALVAAASVVGALAFAIELLVVRPRQRRAIRAATAPAGPVPPLPPAASAPVVPPPGPRDGPWGDPPRGSGG